MSQQPTHAIPTVTSADAFCASGSSPTSSAALPAGRRGAVEFPVAGLTGVAGETLAVRYELVGSAGGELVVALGGISADRHVAANASDDTPGWWSEVAGVDLPLDTNRYRVLSLDYIGGPTTPVAAGVHVASHDQACALAAVLDHLELPRIHHLVGASYGGMVGLAFAETHGDRIDHLVVIGAAHRSHPMATAWRGLQRSIVELGVEHGAASDGLRIARGLAMTTYRSAAEFDARFGTDAGVSDTARPAAPATFPVTSYLDARGRTFAEFFDPNSFATLSESIDRHTVDPGRIRTPADIVTIDTDALVPRWLAEELRGALAGPVRVEEIASKLGHDAFLADPAPIGAALRRCLAPARTAAAATRTVRAAVGTDREHGAVMPPLYLSSNYTFESLGVKRQHDYSRTSNPTRDHLADAIADFELAAGAAVTSSGMSAVALVLQLLEPGDLVIATHDCYGGTHRLASRLAARGAFRLEYTDLTTNAGLEAAAARGPRLLWIETPSNPLLRITDLGAAARAAHGCGALLAVDNTFLSPALQRPIQHGADIVVHSTTKFINGHSDVVGGAVAAATPALVDELAWWANALGLAGSPFDSYLTLRGLRTLDARMRVHQENAAAIANQLAGSAAVSAVYYPGLTSHPGHATAAAQQDGAGSLLSFELAGGHAAVAAFVDGLEHFALAESLGGVESLIAQPTTMTHAAMEPAAREAAGIRDSLLRLSVGIESCDDLVADIERGLVRAGRVR
jgi:cystathionine gamma-synthase